MLRSLLSLLFPRCCAGCGRLLLDGEEVLCLGCQSQLPRVVISDPVSSVSNHLFGRVEVVHAASLFHYTPRTSVLICDAKYRHRPWINRGLAHLLAADLRAQGWPFDIDCVVPVPIHWLRRLRRGYNQSYYVALGIAESWHLPVVPALRKSSYTSSQVSRNYQERLRHVGGTFVLDRPEAIRGKHVLLVDDVLTSGATLDACAAAIREVFPDARISVLTLAFAGGQTSTRNYPN